MVDRSNQNYGSLDVFWNFSLSFPSSLPSLPLSSFPPSLSLFLSFPLFFLSPPSLSPSLSFSLPLSYPVATLVHRQISRIGQYPLGSKSGPDLAVRTGTGAVTWTGRSEWFGPIPVHYPRPPFGHWSWILWSGKGGKRHENNQVGTYVGTLINII